MAKKRRSNDHRQFEYSITTDVLHVTVIKPPQLRVCGNTFFDQRHNMTQNDFKNCIIQTTNVFRNAVLRQFYQGKND